MNWLEYVLGNEWIISPAGGATGDAYYAQHDDRKLFLKRNSSPFLAVLSAEGIVPKLVWTRRLENGDVITAQHWLNGRELKPIDMSGNNVAELLHKIHHSQELLNMLKRLGKIPLTPEEIIQDLKNALLTFDHLTNMPEIEQAIKMLEDDLEQVQYNDLVVCHCDINHNNWLLTDSNQLFLIDWDGAMIADPAIDIGMLLYWYISEDKWIEWLKGYGIEPSEHLFRRMKWYVLSQTIMQICWYTTKNSDKEIKHWIQYLHHLLNKPS
ncbi:phosphotransferase family protein [Litchfieldia alkalitelluris]|uniref:phosphotransferase family protein n=1 Tax=Litchfieldia alkalitelluris TaxID=304268 RepID=UPI0019589136|nr:phosphotransferase family protein [Litchfieldia alkalitelluris]